MSEQRRQGRIRLAGRIYVLLVLALAVLATIALLQAEWALAALALAIVLADLVALPWVVVALAVSVLVGAYPASALGVAMLATRLYGKHGLRGFGSGGGGPGFDPRALAAATSFDGIVPESVRAQGRLTTRAIVAAAASERPEVWDRVLGTDPGPDAFDGPPLGGVDDWPCSQYAAEALGIARALAERSGRPLDLALLAAAAALVPLSAADEWVREGLGLEAIQFVELSQLVEAGSAFTGTSAGADAMRRIEVVESLNPSVRSAIAREDLAAADRRALRAVTGVGRGATAFAWLAVAGELLLDLARWILSLPRRIVSLPGRLWSARSKREPRELRRGWDELNEPWAVWPSPVHRLWLFGRPLLGLAAVVCVFAFGDGPLGIQALAALAAVVTMRSVRFPLAPLLVSAWVATISPPAAALLAVRIAMVEAIVRYLGRGAGPRHARFAGLDAVAAVRRDVAGRLLDEAVPDLAAARERFAAAVGRYGEDPVLEAAIPYGIGAWARWRWPELLRLAWVLVRGVVFNRWTDPLGTEGFDRRLLGLVVVSGLVESAVRGTALLVSAALAFFLVPIGGGPLGAEDLLGHCTAVLATLSIALPLTGRRISRFGALCGLLAAGLLTGSGVWAPLAIAVGAAFAVPAIRQTWDALSIGGRGRWQRWPAPRGTPLGKRRHWRVASRAAESGRERLAIEMFEQLAREAGSDDSLFAAALGRAALLEVDLGRLQAASEHLDEISGREGGLTGTAAVATGMLAAELGEFERAVSLLREAVDALDASSPLARRATLALCEALVQAGDPDAAIELLRKQGAQPFAIRGFAAMLEVQVTIAMALLERGEEVQAEAILEEIHGWNQTEVELHLADEGKRRLWRTMAQGLLLRGRLVLASRPLDSVPYLERALGLAGQAEDEALRAAAEALCGAALTRTGRGQGGVELISRGVDLLERRRVQLRAPDRRTAMIAAAGPVYAAALQGLVAAQRSGVAGTGITAARLIESLRQSALAETLRSGPLPLDPETLRSVEAVLTGEREDGDVEALRARVREQISARFAAAYLPTSIGEGEIWAAARRFGHVLSFYVPPDGLPGWRVWISPEGVARVDPVGGPGSGSLLTALAEGALPAEQIHTPLYMGDAAWARLGEELIPLELRERLAAASEDSPERILIVPDGPLALVPWAALRVGGHRLVERAVVQTAPLLELSDAGGETAVAERVVAHLFEAGDRAELAPLRERSEVKVVESRGRFLAALDSELFDGAYMASHGDELGLRQRIEFGDGSPLSAASALACTWPSWVVFSSCLVGRVEHVVGSEPFGLAISCLLRGAETVVASVVELTDRGAVACGELTADLADGRNPAEALRAAQLGQLRERELTTLADGLGLTCISILGPPSPDWALRSQRADRREGT